MYKQFQYLTMVFGKIMQYIFVFLFSVQCTWAYTYILFISLFFFYFYCCVIAVGVCIVYLCALLYSIKIVIIKFNVREIEQYERIYCITFIIPLHASCFKYFFPVFSFYWFFSYFHVYVSYSVYFFFPFLSTVCKASRSYDSFVQAWCL